MSVDYLTFKVVKILIGDLELLVESARLVLTMLKENKHVDIMLKEGLVDAMRQLLTKNIQRQFTYYQILAIMYCNRPN
jgi:tRNA A37 N6-isopentenylltransferase MiaA